MIEPTTRMPELKTLNSVASKLLAAATVFGSCPFTSTSMIGPKMWPRMPTVTSSDEGEKGIWAMSTTPICSFALENFR
jgi:hypothetical protein